jgi:hypothetical protein
VLKLPGVADEPYGVGVEMPLASWLPGLGGRTGGVAAGPLSGGKLVIRGGFGKSAWAKGAVI